MQGKGRADGEKTGNLPALSEGLDHRRQIDVGEPVAVVGKEHFLAFDVGAHGKQTLSDVPPHAGVDHGNPPVSLGIAEGFDVVAEAGNDAIGIDVRSVVDEKLLDDVRLVAEAEHEVPVPVLAVITHQMPEDRLAADRYHRLGDVFGIIADTRAETSAEQNCFHWPYAVPHHLGRRAYLEPLRSVGGGNVVLQYFPETGCQRCLSAAGAQRGHDVLEAFAIGGTTVGAVPDPSLEGAQAGAPSWYSPNAPRAKQGSCARRMLRQAATARCTRCRAAAAATRTPPR